MTRAEEVLDALWEPTRGDRVMVQTGTHTIEWRHATVVTNHGSGAVEVEVDNAYGRFNWSKSWLWRIDE